MAQHPPECTGIYNCVLHGQKAPPAPLLPLCTKRYLKRSITKLLNDDVILALAHPVMAS